MEGFFPFRKLGLFGYGDCFGGGGGGGEGGGLNLTWDFCGET